MILNLSISLKPKNAANSFSNLKKRQYNSSLHFSTEKKWNEKDAAFGNFLSNVLGNNEAEFVERVIFDI